MKKKWFMLLILAMSLGIYQQAQAYTVDEEGRAELYTMQDMKDAVSVFNGAATSASKPAITSNPPTFIMKASLKNTFTQNELRLKGGTKAAPSKLVLDGNGYTYTYASGTSSALFMPGGTASGGNDTSAGYYDITYRNMNIGNLNPILVSIVGSSDPNDVQINTDQNAANMTDNYYGVFYASGRKGISLTFENVNYVAGRNGQFLFVAGGTATDPNVVNFKGNNNIIYPKGATNGAEELMEGITNISVLDGTTNIIIKNNNVGNAILNPRRDTNKQAQGLNVAEGASLNLTDDGKAYGFYYGDVGPTTWQIDGSLNLDFTGATRQFSNNAMDAFTLNVGSQGRFTTKGGLNWNFIARVGNNPIAINAMEGSYMDWERNNGRLFTGTPNATKHAINLHNPRFAAFRSSTNNSILGASYANLKINCDANMAAYAYSTTNPDTSGGGSEDGGSDVTGQDGLITEQDLECIVKAVPTATVTNGDFNTTNALFQDAATLTKFRTAKAIFFKKEGTWWADLPETMTWNYNLRDVAQNIATPNSDWLAPRNDGNAANNPIKLTIRDDRAVTSGHWTATVSATEFVDGTKTMAPLKFVEKDGTVYNLEDWSLHETSSLLAPGTWNTDKTVTYAADQGVIAALNTRMKKGHFQGQINWTLSDSI